MVLGITLLLTLGITLLLTLGITLLLTLGITLLLTLYYPNHFLCQDWDKNYELWKHLFTYCTHVSR